MRKARGFPGVLIVFLVPCPVLHITQGGAAENGSSYEGKAAARRIILSARGSTFPRFLSFHPLASFVLARYY
ncbi:hypothetical protein Baya_11662 [Bagarius yarrelli]|uniref:Secreted protein n=1 Tax=Bagarius yarrelli TaxID=175774 RepID=A0A556V152_BAGYA|nr:hypothetical protein Baya_11662 [Bagarius yarrelli]